MLNLQFSYKCPVLDSLSRPQLECMPRWAPGETEFGSGWVLGWIPRLESEGRLETRHWLGNTLFSADNPHQLHGCHHPFVPSTLAACHVPWEASACCCPTAPPDTTPMEMAGSVTCISVCPPSNLTFISHNAAQAITTSDGGNGCARLGWLRPSPSGFRDR